MAWLILLQLRTQVLNRELADAFRRWYPNFVDALSCTPCGWRGPRRTYSAEACKQAAYRRRARGAPEDLPRQESTGRVEPWWDRERHWRFSAGHHLSRL